MIVQVNVIRNGKLFAAVREVSEHKIAELPDDMVLRTAVVVYFAEDILADKIQEALVNGG